MDTELQKGATPLASILRRTVAGSEVITLKRGHIQEHFVTMTPDGDESPESLFNRAGQAVHQIGGQVVSAEVLGISASDRTHLQDFARAVDGVGLPIGWVENAQAHNLLGVHIWLIAGTPVTRVESDGKVLGSIFEDGLARYCRLVGLLPAVVSETRTQQTWAVLRQMEGSLQTHDFNFSDVFRTWFYNDHILDWYGEFNAVRNQFFHERKIFDLLLPASTGIGGGNAASAALIAGLLALKSEGEAVRVSEVPSPFQSSAAEYGSSFSRAVEVQFPCHRRIYVSGTASIDDAGKTVFVGDPEAQVKQTMEVVQAILQSRGMDWADVTRSLAYFKRAEDAPLLARYREAEGLPSFPVIVAENDVCRDELLFEIEVDAVRVE
jgi:enamine deaminase RidA (YjgF/YER057c/UK114 family)